MTLPRLFRRFAALAIVAGVPLLPHRSTELLAQESGRVIGRVVEASQGAPIAGAQVEVVGSAVRTVSALDGRYTLLNVPAGPVTLSVRMIGYQPKSVSGLVVKAGGVVAQDVGLSAEAVQLQEIAVTAEAERGTVNQALDQQRNSTAIVNAVSAEQISRSPDSDAGQAVQRVSGVTVQDGKYVFVRGLGERYTTTSLNGARIPSPEPERKVVPLDLFPAGLLEGITTSKTFTPDQPGDFSGASVDLKTREFPLGRVITLSTTAGLNTAATGREIVRAPVTGAEWRGYAGGERSLPSPLRGPVTNLNGRSEVEINDMIGSLNNSWSPKLGNGSPNGSTSLSVGGEDPLFGQLLGYIASASYSYGQEVRRDETRSQVTATANGLEPFNQYSGSTGRTSTLWGGLLNLSTRIGSGSKIAFNNSYTRSAENEANSLSGLNEEFSHNLVLSRLTFTARSVRSNQLVGEHLIGDNLLEWSATNSAVTRYEPDRSDLRYEAATDPATGQLAPTAWFTGPFAATKTFSDLDESSWNLASSVRLAFGAATNPVFLKVGGSYRTVDRDAISQPYDVRSKNLSAAERAASAEQLFDGRYAYEGRLSFFTSQIGGEYTADDRQVAGFGMLDVPVGSRIRIIGGARVERWNLDLTSFDLVQQRDSTVFRRNTDVLPSLAVNVALTGDQNLRLSASQTLSRPEYREITSVQSFNAIDEVFVRGNENLQRALIQNYDVRWEWFPAAGEVLSLGAFAKRFDQPIERVFDLQTGSAAGITYINAKSAENYGVELEVRKNLGFLAQGLRPFTAFANTTIMHSSIEPGNNSVTNADRPMVGQSGYVVNGGLGYSSDDGRWNATALYNVAGRRISEAGFVPYDDRYEEARHLVDVSVQFPIFSAMSVKLDGKNLFDSPVRFTQGDILRLRYKSGRVLSAGFRWTL
jgi:outer membrane receptor protein involved in Fe transport